MTRLLIAAWISFFLLCFCGCRGSELPVQTEQEQKSPEPKWIADDDVGLGEDGPASETPSSSMSADASEPINSNEAPHTEAGIIFRPDDTRAQPDEYQLKAVGIHKYESKRLVLYSDIDPEVAKTLPPVIDQAYDSYVDYFGELPPAKSGADFQITGYLIKDRDLFQSAGLIPVELTNFNHGQHRGQEFWMLEQDFDYYRRHLLIHEATHCFMMIMPGLHPPLWYLEGMAELFATHRTEADGTIQFAVMPEDSKQFVGWSRIEMIREEVKAGRILSIDQASNLGPVQFGTSRSIPYAWSWALCNFLDTHPRYQDHFRELGNHLVGKEFFKLADSLFAEDKMLLAAEWDQFARQIDYNWDFAANAFQMGNSAPALATMKIEKEFNSRLGWQTSGLRVQKGVPYTITSEGTVSLANEPKPWISEPNGITLRYANGIPIGRLRAGVLVDPEDLQGVLTTPFEAKDCGKGVVLRFQNSGTLMFSINDFGGERADNQGAFTVNISPAGE